MTLTHSDRTAAPGAPGWISVGQAADVPPLEGRSVQVGEIRVAVFRLQDGWAAIENACPHAGGPLADGIVADGCVSCPLHSRRYSLRTGERQDGEGDGVRAFPIRERAGVLELQVSFGDVLGRAA
jgi:nitrite reductase (NADH) small subunit